MQTESDLIAERETEFKHSRPTEIKQPTTKDLLKDNADLVTENASLRIENHKLKQSCFSLLRSILAELKCLDGDCLCGGELPDGRSPECELHKALNEHSKLLKEMEA